MSLLSRLRTLLVLTTVPIATLGYGTTYYVSKTGIDTNPGTIDRPMATISQASYISKAGDTVCLRGGVYQWTKQQVLFSKGTSSAPVTLAAYPYEGVTIDGSKMPANTDTVSAAGSHLVVKYIQFNNGRKANLAFWNVGDVKVIGCGFGTALRSGILLGSSTLFGASGFTIDSCKFINNGTLNSSGTNSSWQPAIQIYQVSNVLIKNNTIKENWGEGVGICSSSDVTVQNNDVSDNYSVNVYLDNALRTLVKNNRIFNLGDTRFYRAGRTASGINMAIEAVDNPIGVQYCTITNNVITNCYSSIWYSDFGLAGGIQHVNITNNTCWGKENAVFRIDADPNHTGNVVQNNVFYQNAGRFISMGDISVGFSMGRNCWYGGDPASFQGTADLLVDPLLSSPGSTSATGYTFLPSSLCPTIPCGADATLVGRQ
jgi:parallel beta-helix repeat protein